MPMPLDLLPTAMRTSVQSAVLHGTFALPQPLKRAIAGKPIRIDGQELALDAQLLLKLQHFSGQTELSAPSVKLARAGMREVNRMIVKTRLTGVDVTERRIPTRDGDLGARLYRPARTTTSKLMVFYHGGGWVIGDLDSHDDFCRFLAKHSEIQVLSVDYRLAPEHAFPTAFDDGVDAYRFAVEHAEELGVDTIAVGGDSAGGNLAAAVAVHATHSELPQPAFQLLVYPATDATVRRRSRELFGNGFVISDHDMDWFLDHYLSDVQHKADPTLSVLLNEDLSGLPPAYVVTTGFDPLRDEGEAYAKKLTEAGVPVIARRFSDLTHGFLNLRIPGTRFQEALFEIAGTVRAVLALH